LLRRHDNPLQILVGLTAVLVLISLHAVFVFAPTEQVMGHVQRIFYYHVASAWVGFLAFLIACVGGLLYLGSRRPVWDMVTAASVEIGLLFSTIALVAGVLWARPVWNTWWTWDPRLTTTLVMCLYYAATLMLRRLGEGEERNARVGAVLSVVGFVNVPIVFLAIRMWRTIHPVVFTTEGFAVAPRMLVALLTSLLAFTSIYVCLLWIRLRVAQLARDIGALRHHVTRRSVR
jgi:heme exporter protein C